MRSCNRLATNRAQELSVQLTDAARRLSSNTSELFTTVRIMMKQLLEGKAESSSSQANARRAGATIVGRGGQADAVVASALGPTRIGEVTRLIGE